MRPSPSAQRPRPDRWLVSYADLVTLLLACFATAFASEPPIEKPAPPPSEAAIVSPVHAVPPVPPLAEVVAPVLAASEIPAELVQDPRGLVISLPESAAFASGSADLTAGARAFLSRLAGELQKTTSDVRVEGHTDDRPIRGGRYGSNWELSTARASAVVRYLITEAAFEPVRLSAAGYGEFHPRFANDAEQNRARNRRVDVVVVERRPADSSDQQP